MKGTSLIVMAWRNLWRNRRRTLITLSSIVFGIFLAVLFTAMQDQNWADTIDLAARLGNGHVTLQHPEYLETPKLTLTVRGTDDLIQKALSGRYVTRVAQRITGHTMLATAGESFGAGFFAIDPEVEDESTFSIIEGLPEGAHRVPWNGRDDEGRELPSGVYFARLDAGDLRSVEKLTLLK